jgi:hypothetical protein
LSGVCLNLPVVNDKRAAHQRLLAQRALNQFEIN